jgi:hypothetical protein
MVKTTVVQFEIQTLQVKTLKQYHTWCTMQKSLELRTTILVHYSLFSNA